MNTFQLSCPSKTFFIGEYAILHGAPAFVLNTEPRFTMRFIPRELPVLRLGRLHPQSPIGRWVKRYADIFRHYRIQFYDPHQLRGGCGASTAQFLMAYIFSKYVNKPEKIKTLPISNLLNDYLSVAWNGQGTAPSGADLVSQFSGKITYFEKTNNTVDTLSWSFKDLSFLIVRTGQKIATHHHLQGLKDFAIDELKDLCQQTYSAFKNQDSTHLIDITKNYHNCLIKLGFVAEKTAHLLNIFCQFPEVIAAKGCGAMGADMMIFLTRPEYLKKLKEKVRSFKLRYVADESKLSSGIEFAKSG